MKCLVSCCLLLFLCVATHDSSAADGGAAPRHRIAYATYLGGSGEEMVRGIAFGPDGSIYLVGHTSSPDFPATPDAMQSKFGGGTGDAFVVKLIEQREEAP